MINKIPTWYRKVWIHKLTWQEHTGRNWLKLTQQYDTGQNWLKTGKSTYEYIETGMADSY